LGLGGANNSNWIIGIRIAGLQVDRTTASGAFPYTSSTKAGILAKYAPEMRFDEVWVQNYDIGVHIQNLTYSSNFFGLNVWANHYGVKTEDVDGNAGINSLGFFGSRFHGNGMASGGTNVSIVDGRQIKIIGGSIEQSGDTGLEITNGEDIFVDGVWFESPLYYHVKIINLNNVTISNSRFITWISTSIPVVLEMKDTAGETLNFINNVVREGRNKGGTGYYLAIFNLFSGTSKINVIGLDYESSVNVYTGYGGTKNADLWIAGKANSTNNVDQLVISYPYTPTSQADTNGMQGNITWDDTNIYVKTSQGWKRATLVGISN